MPVHPSVLQVFVWESIGTAIMILLGAGVVATVVLKQSKGHGGGWLLINMGWGMAVFAGASIAWRSGAHLNPAVTLGLTISNKSPWALVPVYFGAELLGAFVGAVLCWLAFKKNFDAEADHSESVSIFATAPAVRHYGWNTVTEVIATFVLVFWILLSPGLSATDGVASLNVGNAGLGYAAVAFVVLGLGASLGGPTGYAINPARDLGPRVAYALLPIKGKGSADWRYAWVPIVGPLLGGALAGLLFLATRGTLG
ncbi:MIP/aquaporin family protein [Tomitella biformata]|uniref:MIP/aquaporin family protein n=1 Tax=Tomitella biformata TaxID=630403 RepID=UPI0004677303|nr:MIP/aquaporin family protein [Tomitella biformata]